MISGHANRSQRKIALDQRSFKLLVAYDGTAYAGWQIQVGQPTVQGMLERALAKLTGKRVHVTGSGRTDSGVHARGQVASITTDAWRAGPQQLLLALNTKLPNDIAVLQVDEMATGFHAIRDAVGKCYRYQLQIGGVRDPIEYRYRWQLAGPLDIQAMRDAANRLRGYHDFASFQATGSDRKTTHRHVRRLELECLRGRAGEQHVNLYIEADGFLYNMVRNIVGSLVEVGRGKQSPDWIDFLLQVGDRQQAGPTAPPQGLCLMRVDYAVQPLPVRSK